MSFLCFLGTTLGTLSSLHPPESAVLKCSRPSQSFIQSLFISNFFPYHLWSFHHYHHALSSTSDLRFDGGALIDPRLGPKHQFYICRLHKPDTNPKNRFLERPRASSGDERLAGYIKDLQRHMGAVRLRTGPRGPPGLIRLLTCVDRLGSTGLQTHPTPQNLPASNFLSMGTPSLLSESSSMESKGKASISQYN